MAKNKIKGLTVEIGGDSTKLGKALDESKKKSKSLQSELKQVEKLLKLDPKNVELLSQKQKILTEQVEETKKRLALMKDEQAKVNAMFQKGEIGEEEYRKYRREVEQTELTLKNLEKQLSETGDKFSEVQRKSGAVTFKNTEDKVEHFKGKVKDMTDAALDNAEKLSKGFDKVGDGLEKVGGVVNKGSAAAAAVLAGSVAAFKDLDEGYDVIVKKTGAVDSKFDGLKQTADELFGNSVFDMTDIGNAIGEVNTRFGYTDEVLKSVTEQYLQFAKINDADVSDSVAKTARIMQAWDISSENLPDLLGMITAKGQETGIAVGSLMDKVLDNNATFKEMGLSLEESINLMAQFEKNGINDSTALAAMKTSVKNAAKEGLNLTDVLGGTIEKIKNAATDTEALQIATELFGSKGAAEMVNAIKEGRINFDDLSGSMSSYKDTVKKTYDATVDPLEESKKVINNLKLAGTELAATALKEGQPLIEDVIDGVKSVTNWLKKLTPEQKKTLTKAIEIMAVVGPGVTVVGKLSKGIGSVVGILPKVATAVKGFGAALSANPVGAWTEAIVLAVTAIATLTAAVNEYSNLKWESTESAKFAAEVDKAADALEESAQKISETTEKTFENIGESIKNNSLIDTYQSELDKLLGKQNLTDEEKSKLDLIVKYLTDNVDGFSDAWDKYTIRDEDGNITLVDDLDTVRQALNDTIDEFQKNSYISLMEKSYSDSLSDNLAAITEREKSRSALDAESKQFSKRLSELGISEDKFKEAYNRFGEGNLFNMKDIPLNTNLNIDDYRELAKMYSSMNKYRSALLTVNQELRESDELQQDSLDIINVLNGSYDDAAAVLMAFKLNMISLEDVTRNGWSSIEELEKSAAETGKNTVYGVGQDMTDYEEKVYSSTDEMTKDFVDKLSVNKNAAKDTVDDTAQTIEDGKPKMEKAAEEFADPPKIAMQELPLESKKAGGNFVSGFVSALFDGAKTVWNAAQNIGSTALNAIKSFLGIQSPSKEAYKIGDYFTEGFNNALRDGNPEAMRNAEKLAQTARDALGGKLHLFDENSLRAPVSAHVLTDYSVSHTLDFKRSAQLESMRNDIRVLSGEIDKLAQRPIRLYVAPDKFVGGTIDQTYEQLSVKIFEKERGL